MRENSPTTPEKVAAYNETAPSFFIIPQVLADVSTPNPTAR